MSIEIVSKKPRASKISEAALKRLKDQAMEKPGLSTYGDNRGGVSITPTHEGTIKSRSYSAMTEQLDMQIGQIYEQMQLLAKQVDDLKQRRDISIQVYEAKMSFEPVVGEVYYLYEIKGTKTLSVISPAEWGKKESIKYLATLKLLADRTWDVIESSEKSSS